MEFVRRQRIERITIEGRKAAAFRRRQARELEKYPLLAGEIAESLPSIEQAEAYRNELASKSEQRQRNLDARIWKESRRDYFSSDDQTRSAIRRMWKSWAGPKTVLYFRYVVDRCTGLYDQRCEASKQRDIAARKAARKAVGLQQSMELESA